MSDYRASRPLTPIPKTTAGPRPAAPTHADGSLAFAESTTTTDPAPKAKPPAKFTIRCELDGFPIAIELIGTADQLRGTVKKLRSLGAVPPGEQAPDWPDEPFE